MVFIFNLILCSLFSKPVLQNLWNIRVNKTFDKSISRQEYFSPYIIGKDIMQGSHDGLLLFIDKDLGTVIRKNSKMGGFEKTPAFRRGIFYFTTNDGAAFAHSYRANNVLWSYNIGFPAKSTPDICNNIITFSASNNVLYALDATTGKELWTIKKDFPAKRPVIRGSASPLCVGTTVYSGFSDGSFIAANIFDGKIIFEKTLSADTSKFKDVDANPVLYLNNIIIPSYDGSLFSINLGDYSTNWRIMDGSHKEPTLEQDTLYYSSNEGNLYAIDANTGTIKFKTKLHKGGIGTKPVIYNNYLIVGNSDRGVQVYSKQDGSFLTEFNSQKGVFAEPLIDGDMLYFYSNYAILYAFRIKD